MSDEEEEDLFFRVGSSSLRKFIYPNPPFFSILSHHCVELYLLYLGWSRNGVVISRCSRCGHGSLGGIMVLGASIVLGAMMGSRRDERSRDLVCDHGSWCFDGSCWDDCSRCVEMASVQWGNGASRRQEGRPKWWVLLRQGIPSCLVRWSCHGSSMAILGASS